MEWKTLSRLAAPMAIAVAGLALGVALGLAARRTVLGRLLRLAQGTRSDLDDLVLAALRGPIVVWGGIVGLYVATELGDLAADTERLIQRLLVVLIIASVTWTAARLLGGLAQRTVATHAGLVPSASLVQNAVRVAVLMLGALVLLQTLGISITPIITALGVGGLAVALALQDTLANFFAGLRILAARKIRPGDFIRLGSGEEGVVEDVTWGYTSIRQLPNLLTLVPNAKLAAAIVTNCSLPDPETAVLVQVGVSYGSDLAQVERVTVDVGREVMREVEGGVPTFEPLIRYNAFGDSSIAFTVVLRGQEFTSQHLVIHEFIKRLHARYAREGIEIPFPQRVVHLPQTAEGATRR